MLCTIFCYFVSQVDDDVINAVAEEAFYMKRPLTKYLCEEEYEINFKDYPLGKKILFYAVFIQFAITEHYLLADD